MRKNILFLSVVCIAIVSLFLGSSTSKQKGPVAKTICLNMIVKNESAVITKCLASVKGLIDYWVIVDTGSEDGTQRIIQEFMKGIPGELHEHPWVNFEHNRNRALELAKNKADYTLFIDADEVLQFSDDFTKPAMDQDIYSIRVKQKEAADSVKWFMVDNQLDWKWEGVLHETIRCPQAKTQQMIKGVINYSDTSLGARSKDPNKYSKDAQVLEDALVKDPTNSRYQFYLIPAYINANELELALKSCKKRAEMEGEKEEVFIALLLKARLEAYFKEPYKSVVASYQKACAHTPSRAEPFFYLASYYLENNQPELAYEVLHKAPYHFDPDSIFFTETEIYEWKLSYFLAKTCLQLERFQEMQSALQKVVEANNVPQSVLEESEKNLIILRNMLK